MSTLTNVCCKYFLSNLFCWPMWQNICKNNATAWCPRRRRHDVQLLSRFSILLSNGYRPRSKFILILNAPWYLKIIAKQFEQRELYNCSQKTFKKIISRDSPEKERSPVIRNIAYEPEKCIYRWQKSSNDITINWGFITACFRSTHQTAAVGRQEPIWTRPQPQRGFIQYFVCVCVCECGCLFRPAYFHMAVCEF